MENKKNEANYKSYKYPSETIKKKSKRTYYSQLFAKYKSDIIFFWKIVNEVTGITKNKTKYLQEKLLINNAAIVGGKKLLKTLISIFSNIGHNLASKVLDKQKGCEKYLANCNYFMNDGPLTDEELGNIF